MKDLQRPDGMTDEAWAITKALHPCLEEGTAEAKRGLAANTRWLITTIVTVIIAFTGAAIYLGNAISEGSMWVSGVNQNLAELGDFKKEIAELTIKVDNLQGTANKNGAVERNTSRALSGPNSTNTP